MLPVSLHQNIIYKGCKISKRLFKCQNHGTWTINNKSLFFLFFSLQNNNKNKEEVDEEEKEKNGHWNTSKCWSKREYLACKQELPDFYIVFYCLKHMF